jgi:hypothetical protein
MDLFSNLFGGGDKDSKGLFGGLFGGLDNGLDFLTNPMGTIGKGIMEVVLIIVAAMIAWKLVEKLIDAI